MPTPVTFVCIQLAQFVFLQTWNCCCAGADGKVQLEVRAPSLVCVISYFGRPCPWYLIPAALRLHSFSPPLLPDHAYTVLLQLLVFGLR